MGTKPGLVTIAAAGMIVGLAACGSSGITEGPQGGSTSPMSSPTTSSASVPAKTVPAKTAPVVITIKDFKYTISGPAAPGEKIMIKNADSQSHTLTSEKPGTFAVTVGGGGGTATLTAPDKPGSYKFVCTFHADMMGTLVVR